MATAEHGPEEDNDGNSALHRAVLGNDCDELHRLLRNGAEINAVNNNNETALMIAVRKQLLNCVRVLINKEHLDVNIQDKWGYTALHEAVEKNSLDIMDLLLCLPAANLDIRSNKGFNVLHAAVYCGNIFATENILLKRPDLVDEENADGDTALHLAVVRGHYRVTETLLSQSVKRTTPSSDDDVREGRSGVNIQNNRGHTALLLATHLGRCDLVELLVGAGADVNVPDKHGHTPMHVALKERPTLDRSAIGTRSAPAITKITNDILERREPGVDSSLAMACFLASKGGDLHRENNDGVTPLQMENNGAALKVLLRWSNSQRTGSRKMRIRLPSPSHAE